MSERGNQKPLIEKSQTIKMIKTKRTKRQWWTKH